MYYFFLIFYSCMLVIFYKFIFNYYFDPVVINIIKNYIYDFLNFKANFASISQKIPQEAQSIELNDLDINENKEGTSKTEKILIFISCAIIAICLYKFISHMDYSYVNRSEFIDVHKNVEPFPIYTDSKGAILTENFIAQQIQNIHFPNELYKEDYIEGIFHISKFFPGYDWWKIHMIYSFKIDYIKDVMETAEIIFDNTNDLTNAIEPDIINLAKKKFT